MFKSAGGIHWEIGAPWVKKRCFFVRSEKAMYIQKRRNSMSSHFQTLMIMLKICFSGLLLPILFLKAMPIFL